MSDLSRRPNDLRNTPTSVGQQTGTIAGRASLGEAKRPKSEWETQTGMHRPGLTGGADRKFQRFGWDGGVPAAVRALSVRGSWRRGCCRRLGERLTGRQSVRWVVSRWWAGVPGGARALMMTTSDMAIFPAQEAFSWMSRSVSPSPSPPARWIKVW